MRKALFGAGFLLIATAAQAQDEGWLYYQDDAATKGLLQAFVIAKDGGQLILKCDKTGKRSVYAVVTTPDVQLVPPRSSYVELITTVRPDDKPPTDDTWRYYETSSMAVETGREHSLNQFLSKIADAKVVEIELDIVDRKNSYITTFKVEGVRDAAAKVYESCKDTNPLAGG